MSSAADRYCDASARHARNASIFCTLGSACIIAVKTFPATSIGPTKNRSGRKQTAIAELYPLRCSVGFDDDGIGGKLTDPGWPVRIDAAAGCRVRRPNPLRPARIFYR